MEWNSPSVSFTFRAPENLFNSTIGTQQAPDSLGSTMMSTTHVARRDVSTLGRIYFLSLLTHIS